VVYGKYTIRDRWAEIGDTERWETAIDFEDSTRYPFSERAIGEYGVESAWVDEDVDTLVVIIDDDDASGAMNAEASFVKPSVLQEARRVVDLFENNVYLADPKLLAAIHALRYALK
jgi:hypothetical protein